MLFVTSLTESTSMKQQDVLSNSFLYATNLYAALIESQKPHGVRPEANRGALNTALSTGLQTALSCHSYSRPNIPIVKSIQHPKKVCIHPKIMVEMEKRSARLSCCIDWLAFKIPHFRHEHDGVIGTDELESGLFMTDGFDVEFDNGLRVNSLDEVFAWLGLEKSTFRLASANGFEAKEWSQMYTLDHKINIYFNSEDAIDGKGYGVCMTGQGCRIYEEIHGQVWLTLLAQCVEMNCKFSRFDMAIDDRPQSDEYSCDLPYFTPELALKKLDKGHYTSRWEDYDFRGGGGRKGRKKGLTVYIGSRQSRSMLRIYDKEKEINRKIKDEKKKYKGAWIRTELEMRDHVKIFLMVGQLLEGMEFGQAVTGYIKNYLSFRDETINPKTGMPYKNMARDWHECEWWTRFIGFVSKLQLTAEKPDRTLEKSIEALKRQYAPILHMIKEYYTVEGDLTAWENFLTEIDRNGLARMSSKHEMMLQDAINRYYLTQDDPDSGDDLSFFYSSYGGSHSDHDDVLTF